MPNILEKLVYLPFSLRQRRLARTRRPLSEAQFASQIADRGGDAQAALAIWRHLSQWISADGFAPDPSDSLGSVFGISEEELDEDLVLGVFAELGLKQPTTALAFEFGRLDTPLRVAQFVAHCRRLEGE